MKNLLVDVDLKGKLLDSDESEFERLLTESICNNSIVGNVISGIVRKVSQGYVWVDVGLKSEGRIPIQEFCPSGVEPNINVGDKIDLFLENMEDRYGNVVLSREKATREEAWLSLSEVFAKGERINGIMFDKVRGGFAVDLNGVVAFLPGSHMDIRPVKDKDALMGIEQPFKILKMEKERNNIVVSRKAILAEDLAESKAEMVKELQVGKVIKGVVKNLIDYGAFVDVNGVFDGLLHVTDISWKRINKPAEVLSIGQEVEVMILSCDPQRQRIALGMKQLTPDPWEHIEQRFNKEEIYSGTITNVTEYGAFVELEEALEGLVHVSEMSWSRRNINATKLVESGQKVQVKVLEIDKDRRRIALGMKQCVESPWLDLETKFPVGSEVEGTIRNITDFGLFVRLADDIDGMVHLYDLSWDKKPDEAIKDFSKGDKIKVKILEIVADKERISLGIKQLESDPFIDAIAGLKVDDVVTTKIDVIEEERIIVLVNGNANLKGFIRRMELSKDRSECHTDRFAVGEKLDAKITNIDAIGRKIFLSTKALELQEEKKTLDKYGSADSGASLGDILGKALDEKASAKTTTEKAKASDDEEGASEKKPAAKKRVAKEKVAKDAGEKSEKTTKVAKTAKSKLSKDSEDKKDK